MNQNHTIGSTLKRAYANLKNNDEKVDCTTTQNPQKILWI